MQKTVSLTQLKQNLGEMVNQAAYGQERIVLLARGKPKAALISIEDLERLIIWDQKAEAAKKKADQLALLDKLAQMREELTFVGNNAEAVREVREERLNDIMGLP